MMKCWHLWRVGMQPVMCSVLVHIFLHREMLQHQNSMDSSNSMSIGDIRGALTESSDPEKKMLSIQYDALSIADIGGRRILKSTAYYLPFPFPFIFSFQYAHPTPARTHQNFGIEKKKKSPLPRHPTTLWNHILSLLITVRSDVSIKTRNINC